MALRLALSICTLQYLSGLCTHESQSCWGSSSSSESSSDTEDESGVHREGKSSGSATTEGATETRNRRRGNRDRRIWTVTNALERGTRGTVAQRTRLPHI
ncbi:hypothetical protein FB45DRAFT_899426 [Roridomyces roridus]|uniref:Secreted protein n=1 Tax=Roridomyces roridus TaxID=1738132 RepID=A0AAD7C6W4_9AGAR|nr:hypothetical protein FB45DRAFT_899426 [Roridomyces roridus]